MNHLRQWQKDAIAHCLQSSKQVFVCVASPATGKTLFGLTLTQRLQQLGIINTLIVTVHTARLRSQWIESAAAINMELSDRLDSLGKDGAVITHQQLAQQTGRQAKQLCRQQKVLLISDEHHHLADSRTWGETMQAGFTEAKRILILSGTLFRHDDGMIPFIEYDHTGLSQPDFEYSYKQAINDRIVAPVHFPIYGGRAEWRQGTAGSVASFGEELSLVQQNRQLNTAIASPSWLEVVLEEAHDRLKLLQQSHLQAAGLAVAKDQSHARQVAELIRKITGSPPT